MEYLIDSQGIKYIPETNAVSMDRIKQVLKSYRHISGYDYEALIKIFQSVGTEIENTQKSEQTIPKNAKVISRNNFDRFDEKGYLYFKKGRYRKSKWTLRDVISIQTKLNYDYDDVSVSDKKHLMKSLGITHNQLKVILDNLRWGFLKDLVVEWKAKYNYGIKKKQTPVINNPEKRKEMGFGGIP